MNFYMLTLWLLFNRYYIQAINFDTNLVTNIELNEANRVDGSYFGYSILLQRGSKPTVIVAAPKQSIITGGSIFSCDIRANNGCTKYKTTTKNNGTFNGNFLGMALDGDDETGKSFIACAPRRVDPSRNGLQYFLIGICFYHRNSSSDFGDITLQATKKENMISSNNKEYYYDYGFAQAGIDIAYNKETSEVIMGAVGVKNWNGAIVIQSLRILNSQQVIPKRTHPLSEEIYSYLGYSVGYGNLPETFLFAGAPRAENLFGNVQIFKNNNVTVLKGEEMGGYFGASVLAQDVNADGLDDLFVGAPTTAGATFDEGCVYFYKNTVGTSVKLVGKAERGARFGTTIAALGDIDLDSYNDVAIAAPFEDDGVGVVYIFMGSKDGIRNIFSQRLVPASFLEHVQIKGFGLGISKGNDIDDNGHNDLAIGAYKSGHVVIIYTKSVIDFHTDLQPNVTFISSKDNGITLKFCVQFNPRTSTGYITSLNFSTKLSLDYRVKGKKLYEENITVSSQEQFCKQHVVQIEASIVDITPFQFSLNTQVIDDVHAEGTNIIERSVPYSHGCGDDNICQSVIVINVSTEAKYIIMGLNKSVAVKVSAVNDGEPGYQCELYMQVPDILDLREEKKCTFENSTYKCPFALKMDPTAEKEVTFDILSTNPDVLDISMSFEVKCLGDNIHNTKFLLLDVLTQTSTYIDGKSSPEDFEMVDEIDDDEIEMYHTFTVGNFGPSPARSDLYIFAPLIQINNDNLFEFVEGKGMLGKTKLRCYSINGTRHDINFNSTSTTKTSLSRTVSLNCDEISKCLEIFCEGKYLYESSETARYVLTFVAKRSLLAEFFKVQQVGKNIIAFITSAVLSYDNSIEAHAVTLFLSSHSTRLPLWVYIVAAVAGILLLGFIVLICYKCNFFDRRYRDKMNDELLMDEPVDTQKPTSSNNTEAIES